MPVARIIRSLLALITLGIVVWSFFDVGRRVVQRRRAEANRPITLTVVHWGAPSEDKIVEDLVKAYVSQEPRVRIVRINPGDASITRNKMETMFAAGDPPDVFYLPPDQMKKLAKLKLVAPIDQFVNQEQKEWLDDFFPTLFNAFRYEVESDTVGKGALYALPKDFTTVAFYVNTNLCDAAGVDWRDIQKNGWTWERFAEESRKIMSLRQRPEFSGREIYGSFIQSWPGLMRNILWSFDGDFFQQDDQGRVDFKNVALENPGSQRGLEFLIRVRLQERTSYNPTGIAKDGSQEFINGNIGFTGPVGRWFVPIYKDIKLFKWDIVPMPYATRPVSTMFYTGWGMSSSTKHPAEAYKLIRFLCSDEGQHALARSALSIPSRMKAANSQDFLNPMPPGKDSEASPMAPHNEQVFLDAAKNMRVPQDPEQSEWSPIFELGLNRTAQTGQDTPMQAAEKIQAEWSKELASPLRQRRWPPMPWGSILTITACALFTLIVVLVVKARRERLGAIDRAQERSGWAFIMPWAIGFLFLAIGPMIVSLVLAFSRWTGLNQMSNAEYVGSANFRTLLSYDSTFWQSLRVTAYYVLLGVPVTQVCALAVALLMNSKVAGITIFRTIFYVPAVVSGVALAVLWLQLFNNDFGLINEVLRPIARLFDMRPPNWFGVDTVAQPPVNDAKIWGVPGFVIMGLWGVGGGMILYLAGLKGIPQSLYEAARIDGAGAVRRLWNVTLPMLSPLIFYNVVMGIIGSFQIFTQAYVMVGSNASSRGGPDNALLFYVVNLYRQAFDYHNMGYASAMAWVLFVIVLLLTILVFRGSRNLVYYEGLKA